MWHTIDCIIRINLQFIYYLKNEYTMIIVKTFQRKSLFYYRNQLAKLIATMDMIGCISLSEEIIQ